MNERLRDWYIAQAREVIAAREVEPEDIRSDPDAEVVEVGMGADVYVRLRIIGPLPGEPVDEDGVPL